jgi:hypothetical protein
MKQVKLTIESFAAEVNFIPWLSQVVSGIFRGGIRHLVDCFFFFTCLGHSPAILLVKYNQIRNGA